MKRDFAKIHVAFGKLLLVASAVLWTSCDEDSSSAPEPIVLHLSSSSESLSESSSSATSQNSSSSVSAQTSSSSEQSQNEDSSLLSVEEVVGKFVTDTTGLRDKCITKRDYCTAVARDWGFRFPEENIRWDYSVKIDTLLSTKGDKMGSAKKNCLSGLINKLRISEGEPVYGVSPCYYSDEDYPKFKDYKGVDCKLEESANNRSSDTIGAIADDSYIKALSGHNDDVRETAIQELSKIEASIDSCAHFD